VVVNACQGVPTPRVYAKALVSDNGYFSEACAGMRGGRHHSVHCAWICRET